jgi:hypothetical protein
MSPIRPLVVQALQPQSLVGNIEPVITTQLMRYWWTEVARPVAATDLPSDVYPTYGSAARAANCESPVAFPHLLVIQ